MQTSPIEPRPPLSENTAYGGWLVFALGALALTFGPLVWFLDYFADTGPYLRPALATLLILLTVLAWGYSRFLPRRLRGREPVIFAALVAAATLLQEPRAALAIAAFAAACYALGTAALGRLGVQPDGPLARTALSTGVGLGVWVVGVIPLGLTGWFRWWVFAVLAAVCLAAFRRRLTTLGRDARQLAAAWREVALSDSRLAGILVAFFPAFAAAFWLAALAPSTATDSIAFHLPAARHYLESGTLDPIPRIEGIYDDQRRLYTQGHSSGYGYYPQSFEALLGVVWGLGGQAAAQMLSPLFALLVGLAIGALGRRCGLSRRATLIGMAAGLALPFVSWNGAIAKNDMMLTFFQLGALWSVVTARGEDAARRLLLAAFFLGITFGTKHVALYGAIPIGLLMLFRLARLRRPVALAAALAAIFAVSGLTWHVRTWLATGNPLYPARIGFAKAVQHEIGRGSESSSPWINRLRYPWIAHFEGALTLESPLQNPMGFYLVFFAPAWLLLRRRKASQAERDCLLFCAVFSGYWIYTWPVLRYGAPLVLMLVMLTAKRVEALIEAPWKTVRAGSAAALTYCFALALPAALIIEVNVHQLRYFARRIDAPEYLRTLRSDYRALEELNVRMRPDEHALAISQCINAYAKNPLRYRCVDFGGEFSEDELEDALQALRLTTPDYLVLPKDEKGERIFKAAQELGYRDSIYEDEAWRIYAR